MHPHKVGLAVGAVAGLWHLVWGMLVALGVAQVLINFVYAIHFLSNPFTVLPFDTVRWVTLVVVTGIFGYIVGYVFALVWNWLHK